MSTSRSPKGQAAIEFALVTSFMLLLFTVLFLVVGNVTLSSQEKQEAAQLNLLAETIKSEILLAKSVEDGYSRDVELPLNILGLEYEMQLNYPANLDFSELTLNYKHRDTKQVIPLPANVTGDIAPGSIRITKDLGIVTIAVNT
ncbi:MAG: hypothetical protein KJ709_00670 [Nanoarchaeota archaeon]|nr:hypothetical protein [Nanoarchaeota archaeon]